ncbi:MAG: hypothetical protein RIC89_12085 [Pseudomonadales bacterium]
MDDWQKLLVRLLWKHPEQGIRVQELSAYTVAEQWALYVRLRDLDAK